MGCKDYQAIAAIVSRHIYDLNDAGIALVADLTDLLAADNPNFDRDRFADACVGGIKSPTVGSRKARTYAGLALDDQATFTALPKQPSPFCSQCGTAMNPVERMLGPACGKCVHDNHEAATGGK